MSDLNEVFEELLARVQSKDGRLAMVGATDDDLIERTRLAVKATSQSLDELTRRVEALKRLAVTDELTGLLNRRGFSLEVQRATARARRYGEEGALLYIDIDSFKRINDCFGHAAGDAVLRHVGDLLSANVRCTDHVGRLGGDEFAVLLSRASIAGSQKRAAHLAQLLHGTKAFVEGEVITVHASVGVQPYGRGRCYEAADLLNGADRAMYAEKDWRRLCGAPTKLAIAS